MRQIIKMGLYSNPDKHLLDNPAGQPRGEKDAASGGAFFMPDGSERVVHFAGTNNMHTTPTSCYNTSWQSDNLTNWAGSLAPWPACNEAGYAQTQTKFATPRVIKVSGKYDSAPAWLGSEYFDKDGWHSITTNMVNFPIVGGVGVFFNLHFEPKNGYFYALPGEEGNGEIRRTNDLITWEVCGMMPLGHPGYGRASFTSFNGKWMLLGYSSDSLVEAGKSALYISTDFGVSWTIGRLVDTMEYGLMWGNSCATKSFIFFIAGAGTSGPNVRGCYTINPDNYEFTPIPGVNYPPGHATTLHTSADEERVYITGSNMNNHVMEVRDIANNPR